MPQGQNTGRPRGQPSRKRSAPARRLPGAWALFMGIPVALVLVGLWAVRRDPDARPVNGPTSAPPRGPVVEDQAAAYAGYAGSASCRECHETAHDLWLTSNHRFAERTLDADLDRAAFDPPHTFRHGTQTTDVRAVADRLEVVTTGFGGAREAYPVQRVIGHDPLRQFLVSAPGGRYQVLEASWDPHRLEWFNVYGSEDRQPGEWGHWTGRGMNWNNMCAGCHNTRVRKNYDEATDSYRTAFVEMTVGCEACHGPLKAHVEWRKAHPETTERDPTVPPMDRAAHFSACGFCHSRRGDLTGDFKPGDDYFDHFTLVTVNETDTYFPDGQVRDENYEFAAFLGSRMHRGGAWCLDCHNPHSVKTVLPGNWLCLKCHNGSVTNAPVIDPVKHSFHRVFGYDTNGVPQEVDLGAYDPKTVKETGGECVNCHMPQTVYMQRHWRHDHGFTIPDPLLTRQHGIPNACNRCHADKDVAWAIEWVDKWYGPKMDRPSRVRAQTVARARTRDPAARGTLLAMLEQEDPPYWRAVAAQMVEPWSSEPAVSDALRRRLGDPHPLVREKAARALEPLVEAGRVDARTGVERLLDDPSRAVRVAAAWTLRSAVEIDSRAGRELLHFLDTNADQPTGQLQKGVWCLARQQTEAALGHLRKAVAWDPNSAPLHHELAVVLSIAGQFQEAVEEMTIACRLEPKEAEYWFKLGLAWNELGRTDQTIAALDQAVRLDPRHARAWYNLGLARSAGQQPEGALEALIQAEAIDPTDARIPYAQATVLARLERIVEARVAARRALGLRPDFGEARELLEALR